MPRQGSKSGKSSKTARVLNLLTDPESVEKPSEDAKTPETAAERAKLADDRRTQAKIRGALEEELANMPAPTRPKRARRASEPEAEASAEEEKFPDAPRSIESIVLPNLESYPDDDSVPPIETVPVAPEPPESEMPESVFPIPESGPSPLEAAVNELRSAGEKDPDEYICYNITQTLVEDKADKYIKMFHLCSCKRCRIDVIALALSNLPPKYVVAKPHELIPRLSIYEQKYNAAVVTQVMSACRRVLERPHHDREKK